MTARLSLVLLLSSPILPFNCLRRLSHPSCYALLAAAVRLGFGDRDPHPPARGRLRRST